ncbi:hypothetical protein T11_17478 [Trichinella zimbabwensis]|uniref:Uncharacterized protein n=2 Tax=Trichinella TaxID=6333 RepID=A0A0V1MGW4_9BILA|nr:hypothetical protein T11_17478 [Trichinella zimbabwensis]KRZ71115.1 hypothetical protein T10_9450 [Trichinella papuae]
MTKQRWTQSRPILITYDYTFLDGCARLSRLISGANTPGNDHLRKHKVACLDVNATVVQITKKSTLITVLTLMQRLFSDMIQGPDESVHPSQNHS